MKKIITLDNGDLNWRFEIHPYDTITISASIKKIIKMKIGWEQPPADSHQCWQCLLISILKVISADSHQCWQSWQSSMLTIISAECWQSSVLVVVNADNGDSHQCWQSSTLTVIIHQYWQYVCWGALIEQNWFSPDKDIFSLLKMFFNEPLHNF